MRNKIQNCRIVLQQCSECGEVFPLLYLFDDMQISGFGSMCSHVQDGSSFHPVVGQPTFNDWYQEQLQLRSGNNYVFA